MSRRGSSLSNVSTSGISRDIGSKYDSVKKVADELVSVAAVGDNIDNVVAAGANKDNINAVVANEVNVTKVADAITNVSTVSDSISSVGTVSGNIASVNTVADVQNLADIVRVADDLNSMDLNGIADVTIVANDLVGTNNITTVSSSITDVGIVANDIASVNDVSANMASVVNAVDNASDAATSEANASVSAENAASSAASALASENAASASETNAASSELNATNSETNASNSASAASTSESNSSVSESNAASSASSAAVSENNALASKNEAATSEANASSSEANALTSANNASTSESNAATSEANVAVMEETVVSKEALVSPHYDAIDTIAANSTDVSVVAGSIVKVTTVSNSIDDVSRYADTYYPPSETDPSTRPDGSATVVGDMYLNTSSDASLKGLRLYDTDGWRAAGTVINGTSGRQVFTATAEQTTFAITGGYDAGFADVYLNGRKLENGVDVDTSSGADIVLAVGASAGDIVDVVTYGAFVLADHYTKSEDDKLLDTKAGLNGSATQTFKVADAVNANEATSKKQTILNIKADKLLTVGSGGAYATINEALEEASKAYPLYKQGGYSVEIRLLAGFVMQEQVIVKGIDLGYITITGEDEETTIQRDTLTINTANEYDGVDRYSAFNAINATLPVIGQLFNMDASGEESTERSGIYAVAGSKVNVLNGCGVKNAGQYGILVYKRSEAHIEGSIFSGAGSVGIYARSSSTINAGTADASNAGTYGIYALYDSTINAISADASGAGTYGIYAAYASTINAGYATVTSAGSVSIVAGGRSNIAALYSNCTANGNYEYHANSGSIVDISEYKGDARASITLNEWGANGSITS